MDAVVSIKRVFATETRTGAYASYAVLHTTSDIIQRIAELEKRLDMRVVPLHQVDADEFGIFLYHKSAAPSGAMSVKLIMIPVDVHGKRQGYLHMVQMEMDDLSRLMGGVVL